MQQHSLASLFTYLFVSEAGSWFIAQADLNLWSSRPMLTIAGIIDTILRSTYFKFKPFVSGQLQSYMQLKNLQREILSSLSAFLQYENLANTL